MSVPLCVLVVEDMEDDALLLLRALRRGGYDPDYERVATARDMEAALDRREWDVVLSDYVLPGFGGPQALRLVRSKGLDVPFILVSGTVSVDRAVEAMRAGAHDYVAKGDFTRLTAAIDRELRQAEIRRSRRRAEKELHESEERYRLVVEGVRDYAIFMLDLDGRIASWNMGAERLKGYSKEEILGQHLSRFYTEEDVLRRRPEWMLASAADQGSVEDEGWRVRKDGSPFWASVVLTAVRDDAGVLIGFSKVTRDLSERRRAELQVREAEARYRTLVEQLPAVTYVDALDETSSNLYTSPQVEGMLGYLPDEWTATPDLFVRLLHPEDRERVLKENRRTNSTGEPFKMEYRLVARSGRVVWVRDEAVLVRSDEGEPRFWQGIMTDITARKRAEEEVRQQAELLELSHEPIFAWELDGGIVYWNRGCEELYGYSREEAVGRVSHRLLRTEHPEPVGWIRRALEREGRWMGELTQTTRDGWRLAVESRHMLVRTADGRQLVLETNRDVSERRRAEEVLRESERRFRALVQNASDVITILEPDGTIRYQSPAIERMLGYAPEDLVGESAFSYVYPDDAEQVTDIFRTGPDHARGDRRVEFRFRHRDGSWRYLEAVGSNLLREPGVKGLVVNSRDITERKALENQLVHQAFHDPLTGLPNRALFMDRLGHALAGLGRDESAVALLFLDLDNFKLVNDSLGHEVGDRLLVEVGRRLGASVRAADTVSRFGGDEFTVLLERVASLGETNRVVERITSALESPFEVEGNELFVTSSIGAAVGSKGGESPQELLRNADVAMYRAKAGGRGRFEMFESSMSAGIRARLELETDLRRAIENREFVLHYQPLVDLESGRVCGLEALVRWEHPERGLVPPLEFIPLAEETGLIVPIGRWVLREASRQAREWGERFGDELPLMMSVNLSARQIRWGDCAAEVAEVLRETGLDPACLELEITESMVLDDAETAIEALERLKSLGVRIAVDDFGTGYSSLSYLRRLPVDTLKIDRSFVGRLDGSPEDAAIVQAVITLAQTINLQVIGEGVETYDQVLRLCGMGCDLGQGYHFSRPLPASRIEPLLDAGRVTPAPRR